MSTVLSRNFDIRVFKSISAILFSWCFLMAVHGTMCINSHAAEFSSDWQNTPGRVWIGPEYWANPMEDWHVNDGRLEAILGGGDRNVHLLTHQMDKSDHDFKMSVQCGLLDRGVQPGSVGFRIGIQDQIDEYRARCLHGSGINAGLTREGTLFLGNQTQSIEKEISWDGLTLQLLGNKDGDDYVLNLALIDQTTGEVLESITADNFSAERLYGNIALVQNHSLKQGQKNSDTFWFQEWKIEGTKVENHPEQTFGPILWSMHTLSRGVMKMTAQMPPMGINDSQTVQLQLKHNHEWQTVAREEILPLARTATFRLENWNDEEDVPYRLLYNLKNKDGSAEPHYWYGTVRRDPVDRPLEIAGFTGNTDSGFPNHNIANNVKKQDPDMLFFSGDQIYENVGGYGIYRQPTGRAVLNYLRKWYLLGWAFGDLMRDRVTVCLSDDHDVYQGNIWGNGGNPITIAEHDRGGYAMHPDFVNVVNQSLTAHHPDFYDPNPMKQGIQVYYGDMLYGRVSFAILADRAFKSGPKGTVATWEGRADHVKNPNFDPETIDKPGLTLLGDRQLEFLRHWATDWEGADAKIVLSQTIFCNLANYHGGNKMYLVADLDSNGWPQSGRERALRAMRKGFAFHYAGDQHLPSIVHHGIDEFGDSGFSFCVPSIAAGYPRSWLPDKEGRPVRNRPEPGLPNTGQYLDGLHNKMTVYAIGNPEEENRPGRLKTLHDKSSGYGIVRVDQEEQTITMECWKLLVDVSDPEPDDQFPGWPKTISVFDNYSRDAEAYLPVLQFVGVEDPVVQVIDQENEEIVYTVRVKDDSFRPKVFHKGEYTVIVSQPELGLERIVTGVESLAEDVARIMEIEF